MNKLSCEPLVPRIIHECREALKHNLHLAALTLALTLPDICGIAEFTKKCGVKERYVQWYEEHIGRSERFSKEDEYPYPSGEVIYRLRCMVLHQGTPSVEKDKCNIDSFALICESFSEDISSYLPEESSSCEKRELTLNLNTLCWKICRAAENYYEQNKDRFDFFQYTLIDGDERKRFFKLMRGEITPEQYSGEETI